MKLGLLLWMTSVMPQPIADQTCLAATVYLEARGESMRGQMAVAEVGLHRLDQGRWGKNLCEVLKAPRQFALSITSKNYEIDNLESWTKSWMVASSAHNAWMLPEKLRMRVVPGASHFVANYAEPQSWAIGRPVAVIGPHRFYALN